MSVYSKTIAAIGVSLAIVLGVYAEPASADNASSELESLYRVDFPVPDAPAFVLLDEHPSDILRPVSVRDFGVGLSRFVDSETGAITVPEALAVEISPGLLIGGSGLTLDAYLQSVVLYRLRISVGISRPPAEIMPSEVALGIRTSIIDDADPRTDADLVDKLEEISLERARARIVDNLNDLASNNELSEAASAELDKKQQKLMDEYRESAWNRRLLEAAAAALLTSGGRNGLQLSEVSVWVTHAEGIGSWGQLLMGGKAGFVGDSQSESDSAMEFDATLSSRLYVGVNDFKMFAELQWASMSNTLLINGGGEATLIGDMWVGLSGGVQRELNVGTWEVISKFDVKIGLPTR